MVLKALSALACGAALALPLPGIAQSPQPLRRLVYTFTWGNSNDTETNTSGFREQGVATGESSTSAASGMAHDTASDSDRGTISVDVTREQPDSGLILSISEQAQTRRSSPPATCVVYGDTTVVCDPNKHINAEEFALLRFLGAHFVDPNALDAKQHWHVERDGAITTIADYTIAKNEAGVLSINEVRIVKQTGSRPLTTNTNATIGYDFSRSVPTAISEYSIQRSEQGDQYVTVTAETVLQLQTDSMASHK